MVDRLRRGVPVTSSGVSLACSKDKKSQSHTHEKRGGKERDVMLPRERVIAALSHQSTDRVPLDFWTVPEIWARLREHFKTDIDEDILKHLSVDIRQFQPDYIGPEVVILQDNSYFDELGVHRRKVKNEYGEHKEYAGSPLGFATTVNELEAYERWPNIEHFDFSNLSKKIGNAHQTYYVKIESGGLFELAWALRGYEQFMMDMVLDPEIPHFIMAKLTDFYCEYVRRAMDHAGDKIDMVYTYDDIAGQNSLLISKDMWKEYIKPYHKKLNETIKSYDKTIMYHSCGAIYEMIDELIALPIDVLNPLQPRAEGMNFGQVKQEFGERLSFHGGIDVQHTLPNGTIEEVTEAVWYAIKELGKDGGYILSSAHRIQADTPVENILAMYKAATEMQCR